MNRSFKAVFIIAITAIVFLVSSCGLEEFPLVYPIPQSNIQSVMNNRAVVYVPSDNAGTTFSHFAVFYRIYISNSLQAETSSASFPTINSVLVTDHNAIRPHIDSTTSLNVNFDAFFTGRGFHHLSIAGHNINLVLSSSVFGSTLEFNFPSFTEPTMSIGQTVYTLSRSERLSDPQPSSRLFINNDELRNPANIDPVINGDVVDMPNIAAGERRYTYAAFYIVAVGINQATYSFIYSTPSLIHVFQLPDRW